MTANGWSCTIWRHLDCPSFGSIGFTSYCLMTSLRPQATPPDLLMLSTTASAILCRSGRMSNVEFPIEPASRMFDMSTCTSVEVTPGALAVRPAQVAASAVPPAVPETAVAARPDDADGRELPFPCVTPELFAT